VRKKKEIFDKLSNALKAGNQTIEHLFKAIDSDRSGKVHLQELVRACEQMNLNVGEMQLEQIFESIDFDGDGSITLPELVADFNHVTHNSLVKLVRDNEDANRERIEDRD